MRKPRSGQASGLLEDNIKPEQEMSVVSKNNTTALGGVDVLSQGDDEEEKTCKIKVPTLIPPQAGNAPIDAH